MKLKIILILITVALSTLFTACSNRPPEEKVTTAIKTQLEKEFPSSWSESLLNAKNAKVDSIKIVQFGNFNENENYWPVKARIYGTYEVYYLIKTDTVNFDKIGDFKISEDDYGNWKANLKEEQ